MEDPCIVSIVRDRFDVENMTAEELHVHLKMAQARRQWIMNEIRECDRLIEACRVRLAILGRTTDQ